MMNRIMSGVSARNCFVLGIFAGLAACGGGGGSTPAPGPGPANRAPQFTSGSAASVVENTTGAVYTVTASDLDGDGLTYSIAGGADAKNIQRRKGHATIRMTLDTYGHLWPNANDRTRNAASALIEESLGPAADSLRTEDRKQPAD